MTLVDTGYLFALMNPTDELRGRALAWSRAVDGPLLVTEYVLVEFVNALSSHQQGRLSSTHQVMTPHGIYLYLPVDLPLLRAGLPLYAQRLDKHWSLTDCISLVVMRERGLTRALAYDHHFELAGFDPLSRRNP